MDSWKTDIIERIKGEPDAYIHWYINAPPDAQHFIRTCLVAEYGMLYVTSVAIMKSNIAAYEVLYNKTPTLLVLEPRKPLRSNAYAGLEEIKQMCFPRRGTMVFGDTPHLLVFADCRPDYSNTDKKLYREYCFPRNLDT